MPLLPPTPAPPTALCAAAWKAANGWSRSFSSICAARHTLGEARLPYDVLFILNQFFNEMNRALAATGGHYSNFTGDGLMAIYGLEAADPARGRLRRCAARRKCCAASTSSMPSSRSSSKQPLRIGIGIHFGEAIVGAMGPPRSQIVTAIGDTVNTTARLEGLTKDYDCVLILSQRAAQAAGIDLPAQRCTPRRSKDARKTSSFMR